MATFQAPDGRMLTVPDQLMPSFALPPPAAPIDQQIAPGLAPPAALPGGELGPPPITPALAEPTDPVQPIPATGGGSNEPVPTPAAPQPQGAAGAAAPAPTPVVSPIADVPSTFQGADVAARSAFDERAQAAQIAGDVDAQKAAAQAAELRARNEAVDQLRVRREQERVQEQQDIAKRQRQYDAAIDKQAAYKIDEGRRWRDLGTGRKIAAGIGVALSALGDILMKRSGPNAVIEMIHGSIKEDVQKQMREREGLKEIAAGKRSSLDDYMKSTGRKEDAYSLKMAEELKRSALEIERQASAFSAPEAKVRAMNASALLRQEAAGYLGTVAQGQYQRDMAKKQLDEQIRARKDESARGWAGVALQKEGMKLKREELEADKERTIAKFVAEGKTKEAENFRKFGVGTLKNKDGTPLLARDEKTAGDLTKKIYVAGEINDIINEVLKIRDDVGGESRAWNSDESQRLLALQSRLNTLAKDGTEGLSSENDMRLLAQSIGAADITSFRSRAAGLIEGRERTTSALNRELRTNRYTGDAIKFENQWARTPEQSAEERKLGEAVKKPQISYDAAVGQALKQIKDREGIGTFGRKPDSKESIAITKEARAAAEDYQKISPDQRATIRRLGTTAYAPGAAGDMAFKQLRKISDEGETEAIRKEALDAIQRLGLSTSAPRRDESGATVVEGQ